MTELLRLDEVGKSFRGRKVVDGISFTLRQGRAVGLLGPNGAGKSTLLKIAVGLIAADSGKVQLFGGTPSWRSFERVAFLPDRGHFTRGMSVSEALQLAGRLYPGFNPGTAREILEDARISRGAYVNELSKGQEARFHLALCLARRPAVLVLDEPFAGLDILSREAMVEAVIGAIAGGVQSVLMSTHDVDDVEGLFDEVILLRDGGLSLWDEAETLRARYGSLRQMYKEVMRG